MQTSRATAEELEAALLESRSTADLKEGRLMALKAELDRKANAYTDMKEIFEEERLRAEELQREVDSGKRNSAVKDDRITCLEKMQCALAEQVRAMIARTTRMCLDSTLIWHAIAQHCSMFVVGAWCT